MIKPRVVLYYWRARPTDLYRCWWYDAVTDRMLGEDDTWSEDPRIFDSLADHYGQTFDIVKCVNAYRPRPLDKVKLAGYEGRKKDLYERDSLVLGCKVHEALAKHFEEVKKSDTYWPICEGHAVTKTSPALSNNLSEFVVSGQVYRVVRDSSGEYNWYDVTEQHKSQIAKLKKDLEHLHQAQNRTIAERNVLREEARKLRHKLCALAEQLRGY